MIQIIVDHDIIAELTCVCSCFEISINDIVKRAQSIGIIRGVIWGDLLRFSVPGGTDEVAGLWFAMGISAQADSEGMGAFFKAYLLKEKTFCLHVIFNHF